MRCFRFLVIPVFLASSLFADVTTFTSSTSWNAATTGVTTINFEGIAPSRMSVYEPNGIAVKGVSFSINAAQSNGYMFVLGPGFTYPGISVLSTQQSTLINNNMVINLPGMFTALSFTIGTGTPPATLKLGTGDSVTLPNQPPPPQLVFFGITSTKPFNTLEITNGFPNGFDLQLVSFGNAAPPPNLPTISLVANAAAESMPLAPNTWTEIKGTNLAPAGDIRIWAGPDFINNLLPTQLDKVSVTLNGKNAYVYYISPTQINILTPPDISTSSPLQVQVTNNGLTSAAFTAQGQALSPSFFLFSGVSYIAATHGDGTFLGPTTLYPGLSTPAKPGETVVLYANGFGPTSTPVVSGSLMQSGALNPVPVIKIGGETATVTYANLVLPGEYQFNVVVPSDLADGDQPVVATYNGASTQAGAKIAVAH